jgi:hypothetical protein
MSALQFARIFERGWVRPLILWSSWRAARSPVAIAPSRNPWYLIQVCSLAKWMRRPVAAAISPYVSAWPTR